MAQQDDLVSSNAKRIFLKKLVSCSVEQQMAILEIRNEDTIRAAMYTDHKIPLNEHLDWVNRLKSDKKQIVFAVLDESGAALGLVSVNAIDALHRKADWAFYLSPSSAGGGLGAMLEWTLIQYVFGPLGLKKLNCEVIETNEVVVKLHKKFAFAEEGFRAANIEKNGKRIGVYFLGLTEAAWLENQDAIFKRYESVFSRFDISMVADEAVA